MQEEATRRCQISWSWSYNRLWTIQHGCLELNSGLLQEQYVCFCPWTISSAQGHAISSGEYQGCVKLTSYFSFLLSLPDSPFSSSPFSPPLIPAPVPSLSAHNPGLLFSTSTSTGKGKQWIINPYYSKGLAGAHTCNSHSVETVPSNMSRALLGKIVAVCQGSQGPRK